MTTPTTPIELVRFMEKGYSRAFRVSQGESAPGSLSDDRSFDLQAVTELLMGFYGKELFAADRLAPCLTACCRWNRGRRLYWFERELAQVLASQADALSGGAHLPLEALAKLPGRCIYLKAPDVIAEGIDGCFLWVEGAEEAPVLRLLFLLSNMVDFLPGAVSLAAETDVLSCLPSHEELAYANLMAAAQGDRAALALALDQIQADLPTRSVFHNLTLRALQLALYLVTDNAEISQGPPADGVPNGDDLKADDPGEQVDSYTVGSVISQRIRNAAGAAGAGKAKRAHIRKGHWHRYWRGPRTGERQLVVHWVEPTLVGANGDKEALQSLDITKVEGQEPS